MRWSHAAFSSLAVSQPYLLCLSGARTVFLPSDGVYLEWPISWVHAFFQPRVDPGPLLPVLLRPVAPTAVPAFASTRQCPFLQAIPRATLSTMRALDLCPSSLAYLPKTWQPVGEWPLRGQGLVSFFFLKFIFVFECACVDIFTCEGVCVYYVTHVKVCVRAMSRMWRSEVGLRYCSVPSILFEARSILFATVVCPPASWIVSFWKTLPSLPLIPGVLGSQTLPRDKHSGCQACMTTLLSIRSPQPR